MSFVIRTIPNNVNQTVFYRKRNPNLRTKYYKRWVRGFPTIFATETEANKMLTELNAMYWGIEVVPSNMPYCQLK